MHFLNMWLQERNFNVLQATESFNQEWAALRTSFRSNDYKTISERNPAKSFVGKVGLYSMLNCMIVGSPMLDWKAILSRLTVAQKMIAIN